MVKLNKDSSAALSSGVNVDFFWHPAKNAKTKISIGCRMIFRSLNLRGVVKFFTLILCIVSAVFGVGTDEEIVSRIVSEQADSIAFVDSEKVFLKPEHIRVSPQGLFLVSDDSCIPLQSLLSESRGCYLQTFAASTLASIGWFEKCPYPDCGKIFMRGAGITHCPHCHRRV